MRDGFAGPFSGGRGLLDLAEFLRQAAGRIAHAGQHVASGTRATRPYGGSAVPHSGPVREVAAPDPRRWQQEPTSLLLWGWWLVWLASNALGDASLYLMSTSDDTATRLTGTELDLGWALTRLLCVPLFLAVVWGIERAQARRGPQAAT